ncbi:hypothetical protein N6C01_003317 [Vibrio metschnikovii]|uniref:NERD domain-containing protein n=2 Tax=Bacteria TaxID=2 RepID=A0AAU6TNL2_UNCXX|nr:hypothetical protein [Vibrio metschnikovii]EKO3719204.1 hypothetical protein [Vibrio metschnikovii]EKO3736945.1 hypothetical protein [Vibrio metschnikovii]EKO3747172.1 hypothetical protein [Vibrio metschnikovii]
MNKQLHNELIAEVAKLKRITSCLSIESIVNFIAMEQRHFIDGSSRSKSLSSPLKQGMYLLAIASNQQEPEEPKELDAGKYEQIIRILNSIFNKYAFAYFPEKREWIEGLSEKWHNDRKVSMPAFINYFASGFKISTDKIKSWVSYYYQGFEDRITDQFGMSQYEMLNIGDFMESKVLQNFANLKEVISKIDEYRLNLVKDMEKDYYSAIQGMKENEDLKSLIQNFYDGSNEVYSVKASDIEQQFGTKYKDCLLQHFTTVRGESEEITYITDSNPVNIKPLVTVDSEVLYFIANNSFYQAIIDNVETFLSKGKGAQSFLKARDKKLEEKTVEQFKRILPKASLFFESAFETDKAHFEHDLVIIDGKNLLIVEAKASPPREPLRDPSRAFVRINDHFKGNAGIQKAYNQANSLEENLRNNGFVDLYDQKGKHLYHILSEEIENIYCICVTRDDFGALATDLSLLLEKKNEYDYPWVVNISDLEFMFDGFTYLKRNDSDLYRYLDQRKLLHGKVFGTDELEYAGAFLNYGGLEHFVNVEADFIPLDISESKVFDDIYTAQLTGKEYTLEVVEPVVTEIDRRKLFGQKKGRNKSVKEKKTKRNQAKASRRKNRKKK